MHVGINIPDIPFPVTFYSKVLQPDVRPPQRLGVMFVSKRTKLAFTFTLIIFVAIFTSVSLIEDSPEPRALSIDFFPSIAPDSASLFARARPSSYTSISDLRWPLTIIQPVITIQRSAFHGFGTKWSEAFSYVFSSSCGGSGFPPPRQHVVNSTMTSTSNRGGSVCPDP